ncbi:hypothetical protein GCM10012320_32920 [Sinomonas cellulolyticus]|uniref:Uncharacterized protein n=1 Tax=Sinomonas cellulolyticus TaxID=2801916 RepID=A0ABS1JXG8_9MICC|nr:MULTISPECIES: hypothetical protein [Sinomonas]MBL0703985.1 hypothetical protein [Sinomonas cellulolyticus]GHG59036.1 hypothetical protein GCM10012320_32920 [Sinomonas sp. KCTC 49339]
MSDVFDAPAGASGGARPPGAAGPGARVRSGKGLELAGWDRARWRVAVGAALAGIVVCGAGEAVTAQAALLPVTRYAALAWLLSVAAVAAANLAAWAAGAQSHASRATAVALAAAWAAVGGTLFWLRIQHSKMTPPAVGFGTGQAQLDAAAATAAANDQLQAFMLLALFVLGGLLAAVKARTLTDPALLAHIKAREAAAAARAVWARADAEYAQAASQHAKRLAEIDDVDTDLDAQKHAIAHAIQQAKEHARTRIAELLAHPEHTSGIHTPTTPTHNHPNTHRTAGPAPTTPTDPDTDNP